MFKKAAPFVVAGLLLAGGLLGHLYGGAIAVEMRPDLERWLNQDPFKLQPASVMKTENLEGMKASEQVKEMVERWKAENIKGPGWVHSLCKMSSDFDQGVILPDGKQMPRNTLSEKWYFVNDQGLVEQSVAILKDEAGNVLQQAAYAAGIEVNFTFGMRSERQPQKMIWDSGVINELSTWESKGLAVVSKEIDYKGTRTREFTYSGVYEKPVKFGNIPVPAEKFTVVINYDPQTNQMNYSKKILKLADGSEGVSSAMEVLLLENSDASEEILSMLERVK